MIVRNLVVVTRVVICVHKNVIFFENYCFGSKAGEKIFLEKLFNG